MNHLQYIVLRKSNECLNAFCFEKIILQAFLEKYSRLKSESNQYEDECDFLLNKEQSLFLSNGTSLEFFDRNYDNHVCML